MLLAIIADVTVPVSPVVTTVPVVSGNVIVLLGLLGLATVNVVVNPSVVFEPSKTMLALFI